MADELLRTKLMPPPGNVDLIHRDRLQLRMADGLRLPLTLIVAPAGSGKTSLVRNWRSSERGQNTPLAWVALDSDDNDPVRFWRYVVAALEMRFSRPGEGRELKDALARLEDTFTNVAQRDAAQDTLAAAQRLQISMATSNYIESTYGSGAASRVA